MADTKKFSEFTNATPIATTKVVGYENGDNVQFEIQNINVDLLNGTSAIINDIATNQTDIASNQTNISTNQTDIASNQTNISTNQTDIASNQSEINTLKQRVTVLENAQTTIISQLNKLAGKFFMEWRGDIKPYFNFTNGQTFTVPYDNLIVDNDFFPDLFQYIDTSPTITTIKVNATGFFKISINCHFFDQFGDIDVVAQIWNVTTSSLLNGIIDQKDVTGNTDSNWFGCNVVNIQSGHEIQIRLTFSGGSGQSPFPSQTGQLYNSILLERIE